MERAMRSVLQTVIIAAVLHVGATGQQPVRAVGGATSAPVTELRDFGRLFGRHAGTIVVYDRGADRYVVHNEARSKQRFPPFSTFKIPNSLIALETGVVSGVDIPHEVDTVAYPEQDWWYPEWRGSHHTLRAGMKYSIVPLYRTIARQIGPDRMKRYVDAFDYGNRDISSAVDEFWLDGCLRISAREQIEFLRKFYEGRIGLRQETTDGVKEILVREDTPLYRLSAKTGGGSPTRTKGLGWYVGYVEKEGNVWFFATNIDGADFASILQPRIQITMAVLKDLGVVK